MITDSSASETSSFFTWEVTKPLAMSLMTGVCGVKALTANDDDLKKTGWALGFGFLHTMSFVECFTSDTWTYLWNLESQEEAKKVLDKYAAEKPKFYLTC